MRSVTFSIVNPELICFGSVPQEGFDTPELLLASVHSGHITQEQLREWNFKQPHILAIVGQMKVRRHYAVQWSWLMCPGAPVTACCASPLMCPGAPVAACCASPSVRACSDRVSVGLQACVVQRSGVPVVRVSCGSQRELEVAVPSHSSTFEWLRGVLPVLPVLAHVPVNTA